MEYPHKYSKGSGILNKYLYLCRVAMQHIHICDNVSLRPVVEIWKISITGAQLKLAHLLHISIMIYQVVWSCAYSVKGIPEPPQQ